MANSRRPSPVHRARRAFKRTLAFALAIALTAPNPGIAWADATAFGSNS